MDILTILIGKFISKVSSVFHLGNGSTWPGHIVLKMNNNFIKTIIKKNNLITIFVIGTNGKTTTSKLIQTILGGQNEVLSNISGANLINGIASSIILSSNLNGKIKKSYAVFEIDENALTQVSENITPDYIIILNLFRDQLDRYGEINTILDKWLKTINNYKDTKLILNADDPQIAYLGISSKLNTYYFGLNDKGFSNNMLDSADSVYCPKCKNKLIFKTVFFSHLGDWSCTNCELKRPILSIDNFPFYPIDGTYAKYDILASVYLAKLLKIQEDIIMNRLKSFKPAFGRQELIKYKDHNIHIFLSKNPTSFNQSLSTINALHGKTLIFLLNDRIPDGLDVSWIWDIDFEDLLKKDMNIYIYGDRKFDMAIRLKYAEKGAQIIENFDEDLDKIIQNLDKNEDLYVLPNYSAMLDVRKILTGKKIL